MARKNWSVEEKEFIKNNYLKLDNVKLANKLDRSINSVERYIHRHLPKRPKEIVSRMKSECHIGEKNHNWIDGSSLDMKTYSRNHKRKERIHNYNKLYAREKVYQNVKKGLLKRESCFMCGCEKVEAHHDDYDKPLDVIWLCKKHHMWVHRMVNLVNK